MKNIVRRKRDTAFFPVGFEIPEDEIFESPRNLAFALMSALTGNPIECLHVNGTEMTIGLGCFSRIGMMFPDQVEGNDIETMTEMAECVGRNDSWWLNTTIRYDLYADSSMSEKVATFPYLCFNIAPRLLLKDDSECFDGIQFFGPQRLIKALKSEDWRLYADECPALMDLCNYLEAGLEPCDAILSPSEEEYELYLATKDPEDKFRVLLNMITTFASTLSAKLMSMGHVKLVSLGVEPEEAFNEINWLGKHGIGPKWKPTMKQVKWAMKEMRLKKSDMDPEIVKLLWPSKKGNK